MNDKVYFKNFDLLVKPFKGETISHLAARLGIFINHPCGGMGQCHKCIVSVNGEDREACTTEALGGMSIEIINKDKDIKILETAETFSKNKITSHRHTGLAIDIGSTTLVIYLIDLETRETIAVISAMNPQAAYGADVISRISYITENKTGLTTLQTVLTNKLNSIIDELAMQNNISVERIEKITIAGNSTMEHIFAGISPESIGHAPFEPQFYDSIEGSAVDFGLIKCVNAQVKLLPNISGFIGGDITAGILYSGMDQYEEISLLLDIGTNNEIVLGNNKFLLCSSAAAGPALEGAGISCGTRAVPGAIEKVKINNGDITTTTIANESPCGICGSGLIDAIAILTSLGIIESSGKFTKQSNIENPHLRRRMKGAKPSDITFVLTDINDEQNPTIALTQVDIRKFQLAKGAIAAGIEIMLEVAGITLSDIEKVFVAGAFGNYLDFDNAKIAGILPNTPSCKIIALGNSAGLGASFLLREDTQWQQADSIRRKAKHVELAAHPAFQDIFVCNLSLERINQEKSI